ncbi:hypothetical protein BH11PAT3_BH11PAT3_2410 [soil metagenome]
MGVQQSHNVVLSPEICSIHPLAKEIMKRKIGILGTIVGLATVIVIVIVLVLFDIKGNKGEKPADIVTTRTASATSTQKPVVVSIAEKDTVIEGVYTICDFDKNVLNVSSDSGKNATLGFTLVSAIDSLGEKITLVSSTPLMLSRGDKYKITYRELKNHLMKLEDFHYRGNLGSHSILQNDVKAHGVLESVEHQTEPAVEPTP